MTLKEASTYMDTHPGSLPMVGYFVQRRPPRAKPDSEWLNMACTWSELGDAVMHAKEILDDLGGEVRVARCTHTPLQLNAQGEARA